MRGGRKEPPTVPTYATVARFQDLLADWPQVAWSLVVELDEPPQLGHEAIYRVWLLSPDAPVELLHRGSKFELMEGSRVVAEGEVVDEAMVNDEKVVM